MARPKIGRDRRRGLDVLTGQYHLGAIYQQQIFSAEPTNPLRHDAQRLSPKALLRGPRWQRVVEFVRKKFPFDDPSGHPGESFVVISRVGAEAPEGLIHVTIR